MNSDERIHVYERTLHHMRTGQYDYAILEDIEQPDNYVQGGAMSSEYRELFVEVTSRAYDDQALPPLSSGQIDALVALGFSREADPNHAQRIPFEHPSQIARLIEQCFTVLGSNAHFDVAPKQVGFWSAHLAEIEADRRDATLYRRGR